MSEPTLPRLTPIGGGLTPVGGSGVLSPVGEKDTPSAPAPLTTPNGSKAAAAPPLMPPGAQPIFSPGQPSPALSPPSPATLRPPAGSYENESAGPNKFFLFGGGAVALAVIVALMVFFLPKPPVPAPTSFSTFTSADGKWACETPDGWTQEATGDAAGETGGMRPNGITIRRGGAQIEVTFSTVTALVGAQLMFGNEAVPEGMTGSRATGVNKLFRPAVKKRYKGYTENAVPEPMPNGMGGMFAGDSLMDAMKSDTVSAEFSAQGNRWGLGGPVHGYRVVLGGSDLIASVLCVCSAKDWESLKPGFKKVIGSIHEIHSGRNEADDDTVSVPGTNVNAPTPTGWGN